MVLYKPDLVSERDIADASISRYRNCSKLDVPSIVDARSPDCRLTPQLWASPAAREVAVVKSEAPKKTRRSIGAQRNPESDAAILNAAAEIVAEQGAQALSIEAVARRARAGKPTIYKRWPSRGAMLVALYERLDADRTVPDIGSVQEDVAAYIGCLFAFWRGPGAIFAFIIAEAQHDRAVAIELERYRLEYHAEIEGIIHRAWNQRALEVSKGHSVIADAMLAYAWLHLLTNRLDVDTERMARELITAWVEPQNHDECGSWNRGNDGSDQVV